MPENQSAPPSPVKFKFKELLKSRNLTYQGLFDLMKKKGIPTVTVDAICKIANNNRNIHCSLNSKKGYPSTLERFCLALDCKSSDILDY